MAYRGGRQGGPGGGDRGDQRRPPYGHGGAGGSSSSGSFVWPPPATTPRPVPAQYLQVPMGHRAPIVLPHQVAYGAPAAVYRASDNNLFHYDVSINPESKSRATDIVLNEHIKLHGRTALGGKLPVYDGRKSLYTAGSLPFESEEFVVTLVDPEKEEERAERQYKITIRIAGRTDMHHLHQFLRGKQRYMPQETIQVLDVVLKESPSWNYVTVSRSFFSTTFGHGGDIGEGLVCWRGYLQSLLPTQMGLSLNIDISATSFFKPATVIKFVEEFLNLRDTSRPLSDRDHVKIKQALRGVHIETSHQPGQIRRHKITGTTPIPMSQLIFPIDKKGTRETVVQYFWDKYNYRLKYGSWCCLQAGSDSRAVYLPMKVRNLRKWCNLLIAFWLISLLSTAASASTRHGHDVCPIERMHSYILPRKTCPAVHVSSKHWVHAKRPIQKLTRNLEWNSFHLPRLSMKGLAFVVILVSSSTPLRYILNIQTDMTATVFSWETKLWACNLISSIVYYTSWILFDLIQHFKDTQATKSVWHIIYKNLSYCMVYVLLLWVLGYQHRLAAQGYLRTNQATRLWVSLIICSICWFWLSIIFHITTGLVILAWSSMVPMYITKWMTSNSFKWIPFMLKTAGLVGIIILKEDGKHLWYERAYKVGILCRIIELMFSCYPWVMALKSKVKNRLNR